MIAITNTARDELATWKFLIRQDAQGATLRYRRASVNLRQRQRDRGVLPSSSLLSALETFGLRAWPSFTRHRTELPLTVDREGPTTVAQKESDGGVAAEEASNEIHGWWGTLNEPCRSLHDGKGEGETTVEDTVAAPVNRTDGRMDARPWPIVLRSHEFQGRLRQTG